MDDLIFQDVCTLYVVAVSTYYVASFIPNLPLILNHKSNDSDRWEENAIKSRNSLELRQSLSHFNHVCLNAILRVIPLEGIQ